MNKWSLTLLERIINIKEIINVDENIIFDYLRIVDLNKVKYEKSAKNVLFFFSYSSEKDITDEFIIEPFDYRKKANDIIQNNPDWTYVIDKETYLRLNEENKNSHFIIVDNIINSIDLLYKYINENKKAKVIAVTGSVGKTTSVGLIENVVKQKYNVFRIYSKRITPIILKANVINFITKEIDYITIEMSIYHHDHVEILSDLLHPDIAALIGVDSSHLEFFESVDDICKYKASIFRYADNGFYTNLDDRVKKLSVKDQSLYYDNEKIYDVRLQSFIKIADDYQIDNNYLLVDKHKIKLFFNSELSQVQTLLAYKIGKLLNIDTDYIIKTINDYIPVENRIGQKDAFGKSIIFDGDITTHERIKQLANHNYKESYFVIRKFGSAENNKRFEYVLENLDNFTKVFVFDDIEYLNMLKKHPKVEVVSNHDFIKKLDGQIIYHYSGYYRSFKEYNEKNLINIENERYKIMKPEE